MKQLITMIVLVLGCSNLSLANDFPTIERVKFVQECMALRGGATYETMYGCSCMVDHIATDMTLEQYIQADAYVRMRNMRGERGGLFRGSKRSREIRSTFTTIKDSASHRCFSQMGNMQTAS